MSSKIVDELYFMDIKKTLSELGLNKTKADVYLAALELGSGTAQQIADKLGIPRTTVHEILQQLVNKGLVSFVSKGRKRTYNADPPAKLKSLIKEQENKLDEIMPELKLLFNVASVKPKVRFFEGLEGVKAVFKDTLTTKNKVLKGILSMEDLYQIPGKKFMDEYVRQRIVDGIKLQVIRSEQKEVEEIWPSSSKENRELRYSPKNFVFPMTVYLYDNKVTLISTKKENFGMIIESEDFYNTLNNLFEVTWDVSRIGKRID